MQKGILWVSRERSVMLSCRRALLGYPGRGQ
jgi:hypothetical protein